MRPCADNAADETIFLHKELTRIMADFAEGLDSDLQRLKQNMAEQTQAMDTHFEGILSKMKSKLQGTMEVAISGFMVSFVRNGILQS